MVAGSTSWMTSRRCNNSPRERSSTRTHFFSMCNPQPGTAISYYLKSAPSTDVKITISDYTGKVIRNIVGTKEIGINRMQWNLRGDLPPRPANVPPGFGGGGGGGG